jgi:cell wall-associated NlpC family hydrolase
MHRCKKLICNTAAAVLTLTLAVSFASASYGTGTVTGSSLRLRSAASTASTTLATVAKGTKVDVLAEAQNGWYKVQYNGKTGYMSADYLTVVVSADDTVADAASESEYEDAEAASYAKVTASSLNIRSGAGTSYTKLGKVYRGAVVTVLEKLNGWTKITTGSVTGYVSSEYLTTVDAATATASSNKATQAVALAKTFLGTPYRYGGSSPSGFDCSGFTYYIMKSVGVTVPRTATSQYNSYTKVAKADLQPGDLVFFSRTSGGSTIGHVGMYIGDGKFIHSSSPSSGGVIISALSERYYTARYYGACRVLS